MPPKRHHYIPKFFLERFCRDGMLWVYDRESNEFRHQSPVNSAVIGDYYAAVGEEGGKNLDAEKLLSRIETAARPVLEKVDAIGGQLVESRVDEKDSWRPALNGPVHLRR
jgi:hypothetical protein